MVLQKRSMYLLGIACGVDGVQCFFFRLIVGGGSVQL